MRIISDFHDYYDGMMKLGFEPRLVYQRKTIEISSGSLSPHRFRDAGSAKLIDFVVGFCGKIYRGAREYSGRCYYDIAEIDALVATMPKRYQRSYVDKQRRLESPRDSFCHALAGTSHWPRGKEDGDRIMLGWFNYHQAPAWLYEPYGGRFVLNPRLADSEFYRVMPVNQAYQELAMYMAGPLAIPEKPIPHIDDKTMAGAKGFDKYSFRKEPSR